MSSITNTVPDGLNETSAKTSDTSVPTRLSQRTSDTASHMSINPNGVGGTSIHSNGVGSSSINLNGLDGTSINPNSAAWVDDILRAVHRGCQAVEARATLCKQTTIQRCLAGLPPQDDLAMRDDPISLPPPSGLGEEHRLQYSMAAPEAAALTFLQVHSPHLMKSPDITQPYTWCYPWPSSMTNPTSFPMYATGEPGQQFPEEDTTTSSTFATLNPKGASGVQGVALCETDQGPRDTDMEDSTIEVIPRGAAGQGSRGQKATPHA